MVLRVEIDDSAERSTIAALVRKGVEHETQIAKTDGAEAIQLRRVAVDQNAEVVHEGVLCPVEIDAAQRAGVCCLRSGSGSALPEDLLQRKLHGTEARVDGAGLVEGGRLHDGVPLEGSACVGVHADAEDGSVALVHLLLGNADSLLMLRIAVAPERDDEDKRCDGKTLSAETRTACADFAVRQSEERWKNESEHESDEDQRLEDEDELALVPAWIEGGKRTHAVVVRPVEKD